MFNLFLKIMTSLQQKVSFKLPYSKKLWRWKNFGEFGESQQFANFFRQFSCFTIWGARRNVSCALIVSRKDRGKDIDIAVF